MNILDLPFNRFIGLTGPQKPGAVLSIPNDPRYTNHLGTVHASALLALAEATSGNCLIQEIGDVGFEVVPVVRRVEAKFRRPALGAIHSSWSVSPETKDEFMTTLKQRGRALIEITVDVHDEHGAHALAATIEWFVAKKE